MTDLRKAADMALEALEFSLPAIEDFGSKEQLTDCHRAIMALYKALAQPEQESKPIYVMGNYAGDGKVVSASFGLPKGVFEFAPYTGAGEASKIKHSLELIPEQKPVAWFVASKFENQQVCWFFDSQDDAMLWSAKNLKIGVIKPLYTAPPKREWVGLTEDEKLGAIWTDGSFSSGVKWAEAKLKEKNGG